MNQAAEKHLARAADYIGKGEEFYRKAAEEIIAAKAADPTLSNGEIGKRFGKSDYWVRTIVTWATTAMPESPIDWARGTHATRKEIREGTKKTLREASPEDVEEIIRELPTERQRNIRDAADEAILDSSFPKRREAQETQETRRRSSNDLRYFEAERRIVAAQRSLKGALEAVRGVEFEMEERELLLQDTNKITTIVGLIEVALEGGQVDWDAELVKLTD